MVQIVKFFPVMPIRLEYPEKSEDSPLSPSSVSAKSEELLSGVVCL
jgi:hypothetical protein